MNVKELINKNSNQWVVVLYKDFIIKIYNPKNGKRFFRDFSKNKNILSEFLRNIGALNFRVVYSPLPSEIELRGVLFHITNRCNFRCIHCYLGSREKHFANPFSLKMIIKIFQELSEVGCERVSITGGEPLILEEKYLLKILDSVKENDLHLYPFFTNGSLITHKKSLVNYIDKSWKTAFYVSLHGLQGSHDKITQVTGAFQKTIEGIKYLRDNTNIQIVVNTNIFKSNIEDLPQMVYLLEELGVSRWRVEPPFFLGRWPKFIRSESVSIDKEIEIYEKILEIWEDIGKPFDIELGRFYKYLRNDRIFPKTKYSGDDYVCEYYRKFAVIWPNGDVTFCPKLCEKRFVAGNICKESIYEIWTNENMRKWKDIKVNDIVECRGCPFIEICGTGCRADAFLSSGDIYGRDLYMCKFLEFLAKKRKNIRFILDNDKLKKVSI